MTLSVPAFTNAAVLTHADIVSSLNLRDSAVPAVQALVSRV